MATQSKAKTAVNAVAFTAMMLIALVLVNIVANRFFKRVDFTQDHIYTLSQPSKDLVAKLPDRMTVKAFISKDLQPPFSQTAQYVRDMLDEYANASGGKFKWEVIDPSGDAKAEEEAQKYKVPKMKRGRISNEKVEIGSSYLGVAFDYQGNIDAIPEIESPEGLEFRVTSLIKKMTVKKKKVAFANSEGELPTGGGQQGGPGMQIIKHYLDDYDTVEVNLATGQKPITDDVDALVIAGPHTPMSERAKFVVDQYLMHGKSVAFFVAGMNIEAPRGMQMPGMDQPKIGQKNQAGVDDLLEHYGFKIHDDIIMEPRANVPGLVQIQGRTMITNYPTFVLTPTKQEDHPVLNGIRGLVFPFLSSVELLKDKQAGLQVTALASTTSQSWRAGTQGIFVFDPQNQQIKEGEEHGPFVAAYAASGKLKSFFAGKPWPKENGEKEPPVDPNQSSAPGEEKPLDESTGNVRMLVVGNAEFASDEYIGLAGRHPMLQVYAQNLGMIVNAIDWMAQDEALAPIRAKGMQNRPLTIEKEFTPSLVKYANIVGVPLAFILFGIVRWRLRISRRKQAKL